MNFRGDSIPNFFALKKKKKAGEVSNFFVFGDTSHLFNLYLYYNGA